MALQSPCVTLPEQSTGRPSLWDLSSPTDTYSWFSFPPQRIFSSAHRPPPSPRPKKPGQRFQPLTDPEPSFWGRTNPSFGSPPNQQRRSGRSRPISSRRRMDDERALLDYARRSLALAGAPPIPACTALQHAPNTLFSPSFTALCTAKLDTIDLFSSFQQRCTDANPPHSHFGRSRFGGLRKLFRVETGLPKACFTFLGDHLPGYMQS
ncbi:hypothetical protein FRC11_004424 [Ceratobasidium sp. 423]|nr:hypothetical protein FRC11_004424 [Ceratobasidium sp. 423]